VSIINIKPDKEKIAIAKEISLPIIKRKGAISLREEAKEIITHFDLGEERTHLLMAEIIKLERRLS
jgi:hypothetical protein